MTAAEDTRSERRRQRRARRAMPDTSVPSPCIAVCQLDDAKGLCIGCFRLVDEIRDWPILTAAEKQAVLTRCAQRRSGSDA